MHTSVNLHLDTDTVVRVDEYPGTEKTEPFVTIKLDDDATILTAEPAALEALAASLIGAANALRSTTDDAAGEAGDSTDRPSAEQPEAASSPHVSEVSA